MTTAGYAVLAAVAAQLAHSDRRVIAFTDSAGIAAAERAWALAVALDLPVVVVLLGGLDEAAFAVEFSRAFLARRPVLVGRSVRASRLPGGSETQE
jgi:hypothetical protein